MHQLLLQPEAETIDDEMRLKLEQEFEKNKSKIIFDGIPQDLSLPNFHYQVSKFRKKINYELMNVISDLIIGREEIICKSKNL